MEEYFFDVHDGWAFTRDRKGAPLESARQAWIAAARILLDLAEDSAFPNSPDQSRTFVQIRDGTGSVGLVEMSFTRAGVRIAGPAAAQAGPKPALSRAPDYGANPPDLPLLG